MTGPLSETDFAATESSEDLQDAEAIADRRLELMLVCAHPAIAANCRTP
jgi:RNA polymerase sigma-70 factor (ECF subfamily)